MNTALIPEAAPAPGLLVVKPVSAPEGEGSGPGLGPGSAPLPDNVAELFRGRTRGGQPLSGRSEPEAGAAPGTSPADGTPGARGAGGPGTVQVLDPETAERAVVGNMSCKVAQSALEILNGVRSVQQLARWLDARCMSALTTRARLHAQACRDMERRSSNDEANSNVRVLHRQPRVHSVHCFAVAPGIFETAVVVADKTKYRAIAMRLELSKGMWKVTALRIG